MRLKVFILLIITHCGLIAKISGQCYLNLREDPSTRPTITKKLGSRSVVISHAKQVVTIQNGEEISAHCDTQFKYPANSNGILNYTCQSNQLRLNELQSHHYQHRNYYDSSITVECDSLKWNLYESSTPFTWCPPSMASYLLARPHANGYKYLAAICYNFDEMTILSLHYTFAPKFSKNLYPNKLRNYTPSVEIKNVPINFISRTISWDMYDSSPFQEWIRFANYQYHSIIQNQNLYNKSYDKFGGLLDFAWWPGLRMGNWRRYEEALSQRIEADAREYDIFVGISDTVSAPIHKDSCQRNLTLVELVDRTNQKIPLYVWQYLKSTKDDKDNLVVIGVNSPFYEFYNEKDLVFCTDICPQINWLQKVQSTFRYKTMGIVFCCSVDDVRSSNRLSGFPLPPKTVTPLPPPLPIFRAKPSDDILDEPPQRDYQNSYNEDEFSGDDSIREFDYVRSD